VLDDGTTTLAICVVDTCDIPHESINEARRKISPRSRAGVRKGPRTDHVCGNPRDILSLSGFDRSNYLRSSVFIRG
jgi:hypothetical protein